MLGTMFNDRYQIEEELGHGGMGVIYRAHDTLLDRQVAIKVLSEPKQPTISRESRDRLLREAQAAARLNHPNIVAIYDAGQVEGVPFIVMELIKGESIYQRKPKSFSEMITIARQICAALAHAHANGIIHRDLKPENVLVSEDGVVKLTDFGLARSITSRLSADGLVVGTVLYLSPEAALGKAVDGRSDLYSLGVMLYEMTTGELPYHDHDPLAVISQHLYAPVRPPSATRPDIPPALDSLIIRLMSKNPDDRPGSAEDTRRMLEMMEKVNLLDRNLSIPDLETPLLERLVHARLIGREREIEEINKLWQRAIAGENMFLFVTGEPGIGKTRLMRELASQASFTGAKTFFGECYAEGNTLYAPFRQIIKDSFDEPDAPAGLPDYVMADLISIAPELRDRYTQIPANPALDSLSEQQHIFESVIAWCSAISAKKPLWLVVEDIHWADTGTLYLLRHMARRARKLHMLVAMTYRETEISDQCCLQQVLYDFNRERLATRLKLMRFNHDQTRQMLAAMLGSKGEIDEKLVDAIFQETEGNPFYIEEVCKALIEEGKLRFEDQRWVADDVEQMDIPQSIRMTVQTRLSRLPDRTQEILLMAAILGREFDFETLKRAAEVDEETLIEVLESAEKAQIISEVQRRKGASLVFTFGHALIPSSLRDNVSGLRRQRLHRRAAMAIEAAHPSESANLEALAFHYTQAGDEQNALRYSTRAADRALSVYANQEADRYYRQALELSNQACERARLLSGLGEALFRQTRFGEAEEALAQAVRLYEQEGDYDNLARYYARRARAAWYAGNAARTLSLCQEGLAAIPSPIETSGMAALLHETARSYRFNNMPDEALPLCLKALELARRLDLVEVQADSLATLGILSNQPIDDARQALQQAVDLADSAGLLVISNRAHVNLSEHFQSTGKMAEARENLLRASEVAGRAGIIPWQYSQLAGTVEIAIDMGDLDFVESKMPDLRMLSSIVSQPGKTSLYLQAIEAGLERYKGNLDTAIKLFQGCVAEAQQRGLKPLLPHLKSILAELLIEENRLAEAEPLLADALQSPQDFVYPDDVVYFLEACWLNIRLGKLDEAAQQHQEAVQFVRDTKSQEFFPPLITLAGRLQLTDARLKAARNEWETAASIYQELVDLYRRISMPWEQARFLVEWADTLSASVAGPETAQRSAVQTTARNQSQKLLKEAGRIYKRIRARGYVDRINRKLALEDKQ